MRRFAGAVVLILSLCTACGGPSVYTPKLESPLPSPRSGCESAYLAWISTPRIEDMEHSHEQWRMSALEPVFEACDLQGLADASQRFPRWRCSAPPGEQVCRFNPELSDERAELADPDGPFAPLCDGSALPFFRDLEGTLEQTMLCRDIAEG
jgi:hypothetical protein